MRHPTFSAVFCRGAAVLAVAALTSTALVPDATAQGKAAAADKGPDKKTKDAARKAYGEGEKAYAAGDYSAAYDSFTKAHGMIPTPHAEFWIAMSLAGQGKNEEAMKALEALLASPGVDKIGDDKKAEAKAKLDEIKAKSTGEVAVVTTPAGATVTVDGQPQMGETPMTIKLPPGTHKLTVAAAGYEPKDVEVDVKTGEKTDQKVELTASAAPPPPEAPPPIAPPPTDAPSEPPPPMEKRSKVPAYVTLGIAGVGAVVGTFFGIKALGAKSDFKDNPSTDAADDVERNALIADMAFGVAITLGVTGIVLLTSSDSEPAKDSTSRKLPKKARLNVAPYVSHQGGGAAARWTF